MRIFNPANCHDAESDRLAKTSYERSRQDSVVPTLTEIDGTKPLACVEEGLIPDHRDDTWTAVWDTAYERRKDVSDHPFSCPLAKDTTSYTEFSGPSPSATSASSPSASAPALAERRRSPRSTRPPLSSSFTVTDTEIKAFIFENRRTERFESPEAFLVPKINRKASEVPSLVPSLVSSDGSQESGLEDLEERREEEEKEGLEEVETPGKEVGRGGNCMHCLRCGGCTRRLSER